MEAVSSQTGWRRRGTAWSWRPSSPGVQIGVQVEPASDVLAVARRGSTGCRATAPPSEAGTPRTPSLIARLMGIDGLPDDACSPAAWPLCSRPRPGRCARLASSRLSWGPTASPTMPARRLLPLNLAATQDGGRQHQLLHHMWPVSTISCPCSASRWPGRRWTMGRGRRGAELWMSRFCKLHHVLAGGESLLPMVASAFHPARG